MGGVRCDPQSKLRWFSGKLLLIIPNRKRFRAQERCHFFRLAGRERNVLKSGQCADRLRDTGSLQAQVNLHCLGACSGPGVCDVRAGGEQAA